MPYDTALALRNPRPPRHAEHVLVSWPRHHCSACQWLHQQRKDCFLRSLEVELQRTGSRKSSDFDSETTENREARQTTPISPESTSIHASSRAYMPTREYATLNRRDADPDLYSMCPWIGRLNGKDRTGNNKTYDMGEESHLRKWLNSFTPTYSRP